MAEHGVASERLLVSTEKFASRSDVKELLAVGDVYLDSFPFGGVNSLVDPLELGIPVIAWEGETFRARMGAALLRSLGLEDLVATNETHYREIAAALARGGLSADTPAALIQSATTGAERVVESTLGMLAADASREGIGSPSIVVIGAIAALRKELLSSMVGWQ